MTMLDPLTAVSLASSVVQFVDFGIKVVTESIELYHSVDGSSGDLSDLETKIVRTRELAQKIEVVVEQNREREHVSEDENTLKNLAISCNSITSDLLTILDGLKNKKSAGPGRKWESLQKAVKAQTPWNKAKIESLEKRLLRVRLAIFEQIQIMMR